MEKKMKTTTKNQPDNLSRRNFIRASASGLILLSISSPSSLAADKRHPQPQRLTIAGRAFIAAILPAIVSAPALYDKLVLTQTINHIDHYLKTLPIATQQEFRNLLTILSSSGKGFLTGVWGSWEKAGIKKIHRFLERWRTSSITLLRKAYNSLINLCLMTWYGMDIAWSAIDYPGAPFAQQLITPPNHF